ncbi:MAG: cytochrome c [Pseudomonadales bacterium]|nr:cytochrome c [Pseudomonadales bacterium]
MSNKWFSPLVMGMCLGVGASQGVNAAQAPAPAAPALAPAPLAVPVSINALMVTLIDHSAHHVWDHQALERDLSDEEWRMVEYFAIQLAAAGPLIALGGEGPQDTAWAADPRWRAMAQALSSAALVTMDAAKTKNKELLSSAADTLLVACESCHSVFKPSSPTEGFVHQPEYDHLYHLFRPAE